MSNEKSRRRNAAIARDKAARSIHNYGQAVDIHVQPTPKQASDAYKKWHMTDAQMLAIQSIIVAFALTLLRITNAIYGNKWLFVGLWIAALLFTVAATVNWKRVKEIAQYRIWKRFVLKQHRKELKQAADREVKTFVDERTSQTKQTTDADKQKS